MRSFLIPLTLASFFAACTAEVSTGQPGGAVKQPESAGSSEPDPAKTPAGGDAKPATPDSAAGETSPKQEADPAVLEIQRINKIRDGFARMDAKGIATLMAERPETKILDVRLRHEFRRGHIEGAKNFDLTIGFAKKIQALDKKAAYIVYSETDKRVKSAMFQLAEIGIMNVTCLQGGFQSWKEAGLPVAK